VCRKIQRCSALTAVGADRDGRYATGMPLHRTAPREPGEGERPAISIAATSSNYSDRRPSAYLRRSTVLICSISDLRRRDTALSKSAVDRSRSFWAAIKRRSKPWLLAALHHAALPAPSVSRKPATARQTAPMMPVPAAEAARRRLRKLGYDGKRSSDHGGGRSCRSGKNI
jgi:hypothetical protein